VQAENEVIETQCRKIALEWKFFSVPSLRSIFFRSGHAKAFDGSVGAPIAFNVIRRVRHEFEGFSDL
jgi:hypothetical protein